MCCRRGLLCFSCGQQGLGGVSFSNREPVSSLNNTTQQPTVRSLALTAAEVRQNHRAKKQKRATAAAPVVRMPGLNGSGS